MLVALIISACTSLLPVDPHCDGGSVLICYNWVSYDVAAFVCASYDAELVDANSDPYDMDPFWLTYTTELGGGAFGGVPWWSGVPLEEPEGRCPVQRPSRGWDDRDCEDLYQFMCQYSFE